MQLRNLIRCDHCGMSYDGNLHVNCPHCLAPRPIASRSEEVVFYADDKPFYRKPTNIRDELEDKMEALARLNERLCLIEKG